MASIIYVPSENDLELLFLALLAMAIPKKKFEICHSIGELSARLGMPLLNVKAAVLFAMGTPCGKVSPWKSCESSRLAI